MYEDLRAIKQACTELGIVAREEIEMIFHSNAARLIAGIVARKRKPCPKRSCENHSLSASLAAA